MIDLEEVCLTVDQREAIRLSTRHDCFTASIAILSGRNLWAAAEPNAVLGAKKMNFTDSGKSSGEINNSKLQRSKIYG
jgi:hypothetical protein